MIYANTFQWRHNEHDDVINHQPRDCLLNRLFKAQIKGNIKALYHWPLCGEFTGDQWNPHNKGQQHRKCFHLMTSSRYSTNKPNKFHYISTVWTCKRTHKHNTDTNLLTLVSEMFKLWCNYLVWHSRHYSGYGLSQWEMTLHCNVNSHWLSPYTVLFPWHMHVLHLNMHDITC